MTAANARADGRPPAKPGIDWIFGSQEVSLSGFERERGELERRIADPLPSKSSGRRQATLPNRKLDATMPPKKSSWW